MSHQDYDKEIQILIDNNNKIIKELEETKELVEKLKEGVEGLLSAAKE